MEPTSQLHTCFEWKMIEIRDFLERGGGTYDGDHKVGCCGFGSRGFNTHGCLFWASQQPARGLLRVWLRVLRPGRLRGGGHFRLLWRLRDRPRIWISGGVVVVLTRPLGRRDSTPLPSPSAQQRDRPAWLKERRDVLWRRSFGQAERLPCKSRLHLFPLNTALVFRRVVWPAITVLRLFPRGRSSTREVGAPTRDAPGAYPKLRCVCPKRWQRLHCSGPFGVTSDSIDTRKPQFGE